MRENSGRANTKDGELIMKNADKPAMPQNDAITSNVNILPVDCLGLTKREMFAMAAMQGILSSETQDYEYKDRESLIDACVEYADLLLKRLEK